MEIPVMTSEDVKKDSGLDLHTILHELRHHLPSQTPLKDFVHHNTLHSLQHLSFYDAIFQSSSIFGYQVTLPLDDFRALYKSGRIREDVLVKVIESRHGTHSVPEWSHKLLVQKYDTLVDPRVGQIRKRWSQVYAFDLDNAVHPLLFRILCSYLDQGIAIWHFPFVDKGLKKAITTLEENSYSSFFKTRSARKMFLDPDNTIEKMLKVLVGDTIYYEQYLYDQQFSHRGWSGMVSTIEERPETILYKKNIHFEDLVYLELALEIDALNFNLGEGKWQPLSSSPLPPPIDLHTPYQSTEIHEVLMIWQDAFEWTYYNEVLYGLKQAKEIELPQISQKSFQAIFCIDDREDSLRRHIEAIDKSCETLGCPGFFGVEFFFQPHNGKFYEKLCPAPVTPEYLIKEYANSGGRQKELLYSKKSHSVESFIVTLSLGFWAAIKLLFNLFKPSSGAAHTNAFAHMNIDGELHIENLHPGDRENGLQVGFTLEEMTTRVENLLQGMGLNRDFAPIVYVVAHGSSSANNPYHGAYDCGACSGRPGSVNARVFCFMANHPKVRKNLKDRGLSIPDSTQFLAALHDTASDEMAFYDTPNLSAENSLRHLENVDKFENALNLNAKERSRRFASIDSNQNIHKVREAIRKRSVSMFEPRPELGHSTNALCFIGKRNLTKGVFLDRRAFMNSYDYKTDPDGKKLLGVIRPIPPVCGGINLEYYFSRVDNYKLGSGTKLPHNVMGLIGVANSSDGDLRAGLPLQMIEVHDPIRLLVMVEHHPDIILNTIKQEKSLYEWFAKGWVHLVAIDPEDHQFYYFKNDRFELYQPTASSIGTLHDIHSLIETANDIDTVHITEATRQNLPVQLIKH
ncbi:MAG TPA: DUF2309 domain-containing protein [Saprospiraceae bacterium]|nr:DUF2309 domain-containing protein [Saprospiraceae bacterium]